MSTLQCGVMNMAACGAASSSFTQDLFHKPRKSVYPRLLGALLLLLGTCIAVMSTLGYNEF